VLNCGDNDYDNTARMYIPNVFPQQNEQAMGHALHLLVTGTMTGHDVIASELYGPGWSASQYSSSGGALVQTFDDDDDNGAVDSLHGGAAEPLADGRDTPPHAFASLHQGELYNPGTPETQHDTDANGIPDGAQFMPDYLPSFVQLSGLAPYWVHRAYGVFMPAADFYPPVDIHLLGFAGVPGVGSFSILLMGQSFAPRDPLLWAQQFCSPYRFDLEIDAQTSIDEICLWSLICPPPPGINDAGDAIQLVAAGGPHTGAVFISDSADYDNDGLVYPRDACNTDASTNADPDFDILAGSCDPNPTSWDNDLDGDASVDDRALSIKALHGVGAPLAACQTTGNAILRQRRRRRWLDR
jgi:hypothetical protein